MNKPKSISISDYSEEIAFDNFLYSNLEVYKIAKISPYLLESCVWRELASVGLLPH